ncbi:TerB family tellurite resistance protein [Chamaesiphon sp. VAR_69_metabat_338]|uniref:tellurite resistance TerB family protein n=1 Tax=Chamaesiphon sp. VAR_69_metabat_338 TaxID=2964704 RepID=UPI00286DBECD|nr:TerB family tellurite resistance protein [Chamaesiphon sp. VAR_69_metabat_338]
MNAESQRRLLMKILIGVAWLDGELQPAEREYLAKVVQTTPQSTASDPEIAALLAGTTTVTLPDCERWIQEYLGDRSIYDDDLLIEAISSLIYSDGDVAIAEAKLLTNIQSTPTLDRANPPSLVTKIRHLYQNWLQKI